MRFTKGISSVLAVASAAVLFASSPASAISTKEVRGRYFVDSVTGEPFFLKGVDYQPGGSAGFRDGADPLSDPDACARDVYLLQNLGVNTIRIYSIDPELDHDQCMTMLASAGIYLVLDVNTPLENQHIYNNEPWTTYTEPYLTHVFSVIEAFAGYNNTLGFFAGNEIVNNVTSAEYSPHYIKAVVRDMKDYMSNNIKRQIPVGYSAADDLHYRISLADYLESGPAEEAVDFYGVNSYQWCGRQTFQSSGYDTLVEAYSNFSMPIFLSEFGCNQVLPRTFQEVGTIFSDDFSVVFSGGLVYEYSQETSDYGLVTIGDDGSASMLPDYTVLSSMYASATVSGLATSSATPRPTSYASSYDNINGETDIPDTLAADLIADGLDSSYVRGRYVDVTVRSTNYTIFDVSGNAITNSNIQITNDVEVSDESAIEQTDSDTPQSGDAASVSTDATATSTSGASLAASTESSATITGAPSASTAATTAASPTSTGAAVANFNHQTVGVAAIVAAVVGVVFA
ncbi:Glucanosyltransferase-domain-containing protein [Lipomyces arxii]|uniref:Glucanosyltransferase-domain-containing protein n=1 Tax=Lipomyces arxii TaxID=56418 RepID=UPI0034CDC39C